MRPYRPRYRFRVRATVTPERVLSELVSLAARLGIEVRAEPFGGDVLEGRGGLCRVRGQRMVLMDERLGVRDRIAVMAAALATEDLEGVFVTPAIRELIRASRG